MKTILKELNLEVISWTRFIIAALVTITLANIAIPRFIIWICDLIVSN